jgi:HEAT repeat protein
MIRAVEETVRLTERLMDTREKKGVRSMAAVALGLMRNPANLTALRNTYNASDTPLEVKAGCLIGMGLLGDERAAYTLYPVIQGHGNEELQALAVTSLARLGEGAITFRTGRSSRDVDVVGLFEKRLYMKRTKVDVRRAMALALGRIGRAPTSIEALQRAYRSDRDPGVKGFALVSLARIKKGAGDKARVRDFLLRVVRGEKDTVVRSFAVMAMGLTCDRELGRPLLDVFKRDGNPEVRAAAATALGLVKYRPALPDLGKEVERPKDGGDARGQAAVALGMIGDPAASQYLKAVLKNVNIPYLKWAAAAGLASLMDRSAIPQVLDWIGDPNRITRESVIRTLGAWRDESVIMPLLDRLEVETNDTVRASIIVTLGDVGRQGWKPVSALEEIGQDLNWTAATKLPSIARLARMK